MRRGTVVAVAAAAALGMGAAPARADSLGLRIADSLGVNTLRLPWTAHAALSGFGDASKPMCVGVQVKPLWGNGSDYTGPCRYGAPLGAMRTAIYAMDRRKAVGQARDYGLAGNLADHLQTELSTIAGLGVVAGQNRLKREARSQTQAAKDQHDDKKPSFTKRAAVNCAVWGAAGAGIQALAEFAFDGKRPNKDTAKGMVVGCALAVVSPPLNKWLKAKGYSMDGG